jgi:hypothetical protein
LDAFSGLIFALALLDSTTKWVARLQLRAGGAVPSGRKFGAAVAAIALLDDLVTNSTIIRASF